jgi:hypothetical protein
MPLDCVRLTCNSFLGCTPRVDAPRHFFTSRIAAIDESRETLKVKSTYARRFLLKWGSSIIFLNSQKLGFRGFARKPHTSRNFHRKM